MRRNGFTLIEVLLATMILAFGLMSLMIGLGNCAQMMSLSKEYQDAQFVFSLGDRCYPIPPSTDISDPEEDERLNIESVSAEKMMDDLDMDVSREQRDTFKDYVFERSVEEKELETGEEDDDLYVMRSRVSWGSGEEGYYEELVRLVRKGK